MKRFFVLAAACAVSLCLAAPLVAKDIGYYLELGDQVVVGQYTLKEGVIRVEKSGSLIDGLQVVIPPGTFTQDQTFTVSYVKVKKSHVRDYALSPLISITSDADPSGMVIIKIPCRVPDNAAAMAFLYDATDKFTEALPSGPKEPGYVTAMTRVLRNIVVVGTKTTTVINSKK